VAAPGLAGKGYENSGGVPPLSGKGAERAWREKHLGEEGRKEYTEG
jgi:hypothetical protein